VGFLIQSLPAVLLLAGDNKDPLAGWGLAIAGEVEGRDLASARLQGSEQAQVGEIPMLPSPGVTGGLAKDHDVLGGGLRDVQEEANAVLAVGDDQWADRVGAKDNRGGRRQ
jgi:hypothetical protein